MLGSITDLHAGKSWLKKKTSVSEGFQAVALHCRNSGNKHLQFLTVLVKFIFASRWCGLTGSCGTMPLLEWNVAWAASAVLCYVLCGHLAAAEHHFIRRWCAALEMTIFTSPMTATLCLQDSKPSWSWNTSSCTKLQLKRCHAHAQEKNHHSIFINDKGRSHINSFVSHVCCGNLASSLDNILTLYSRDIVSTIYPLHSILQNNL